MKKHLDNILVDNPVLVRSFGFVSILAASTTVKGALLMTLAVTAIMILTSLIVSLFKKLIDEKFEDIIFLILIAAFSVVATLLLEFYYPTTVPNMGLSVSLIAVNSLLLHRLQYHAIGESVGNAVIGAIMDGIGYLLVIVVMAIFRELLGMGTLLGIRIIPKELTIPTFATPIFAFIILGLLIAFNNWYTRKTKLGRARK
ncbi:MAG: Rnf-Nqr domain containing protein [Helcococcus sp.]|nr:Rnf-Nqr domain containing protein [Helcococcus sp.]